MENNLKYRFHLLTWGGFYNEQYKQIHKFEPGDYFFDTFEERNSYIENLQQIEKELGAKHLAISLSEGFTMERTILHRVCELDGKLYYTTYDMGINYPYDVAKYTLEYKWYPGFNDYPFGEDFNYRDPKIEWRVVQEWISGSFKYEQED